MREKPDDDKGATPLSWYGDQEVLDGIKRSLAKHPEAERILSLDPSTLMNEEDPHDASQVVLVDPTLTAVVVAGVAEELTRDLLTEKIREYTGTGKIVCIPWNVNCNHWAVAIIKQDHTGTPHIFYQDSFGHGFHEHEESTKTHYGSPKETVSFRDFLVELFREVPAIHSMEVRQQDDNVNCGPFTVLNSKIIILELAKGLGADTVEKIRSVLERTRTIKAEAVRTHAAIEKGRSTPSSGLGR